MSAECTPTERRFLDSLRAMKTAWREYEPAGEPPIAKVDAAAVKYGEAGLALAEEWGF